MKSIKVVAGLIWQGRRLLICQRNRDSAFPLKWEFPGGKVEPGEGDTAALKRELREELGIDVIELKLYCSYSYSYSDTLNVELRFYNVLSYEGRLRNLVFENIKWSAPAGLAQIDFLDGDLPLVRRLIEEKREDR